MYLTQPLHRALQQQPDAVATICGERIRTVAESANRIARFAGALQTLGVCSGDRVGILAANSDRYHELLYSVPWIGAALNPLNTRWSSLEIVYALEDSDTRVLIVDDHHADKIEEIRASFHGLETIVFAGDGAPPAGAQVYEQLIADADPIEDARVGGRELLGIFYTGGSTGHPKGVMLSHDNLCICALGALANGTSVTRYGRVLHTAPMFHLADLAAWVAGSMLDATHVFVPSFEPAEVIDAIDTHQISDTVLVPTMIQMLVDSPAREGRVLPAMRRIIYGGSPIPEAVLSRAQTAFPTAEFAQGYGMTELASVATMLRPEDHADPGLRRSAGRPLPHVEIRIVDESGDELPRGEVGEIVARGDHVMLGYWNRPEETAAVFRNGWLHTGDAGRMDAAGYVYVVDRLKDMIITGGENVYSAEVENAIAKHPAVAACAVIGIPDEQWGEIVHAAIVVHPDRELGQDTVQEHCRAFIANYKVPRSIEFVAALPVSGAGKIQKNELRKRFWKNSDRQVS